MDLKDTIAKWHAAMCLLEERTDLEKAVGVLLSIRVPSAKTYHNIGCIRMLQALYSEAIQYFSQSLEQDKYLALSYFLRGICYHKTQRHDRAELDFLTAQSMSPQDGIDYRQLGADFLLTPGYLGDCLKITRETFARKTNRQLPECDIKSCLFYPPKKMVQNLTKQDFLGKAKIISSTEEVDIIYATDKMANYSGISMNTTDSSSLSSQVPRQSRVIVTPGGAEIIVPPHPRRPPPALPPPINNRAPANSRQNVQLQRQKSKSAENILDGDWEVGSKSPISMSGSNSGSRLNLRSVQIPKLDTTVKPSPRPRPVLPQTLPRKKPTQQESNVSSGLPGQARPFSTLQQRLPSNTPQHLQSTKPQVTPDFRAINSSSVNSTTMEETSGRKTVKQLAGMLAAPLGRPKAAVTTGTTAKSPKPVRPPPPSNR
ncbi:neutrophil cytosol factor 2 [Plakobranchus ocellatus]|uniref:Neutrophil cytosol factor 2 n=1 Tax=Plakobranchus ocellatus TaxID=259542 RepID=A0AAV3Z6J4_9GAST|nr:neutrophil cytosol factor 2 [Plakobranchus ocellatus]